MQPHESNFQVDWNNLEVRIKTRVTKTLTDSLILQEPTWMDQVRHSWSLKHRNQSAHEEPNQLVFIIFGQTPERAVLRTSEARVQEAASTIASSRDSNGLPPLGPLTLTYMA